MTIRHTYAFPRAAGSKYAHRGGFRRIQLFTPRANLRFTRFPQCGRSKPLISHTYTQTGTAVIRLAVILMHAGEVRLSGYRSLVLGDFDKHAPDQNLILIQ